MLCIGYAKSAPDEGFASAERDPHSPSLCSGTLSHKGRGGFSKLGFFLFYINVLLSYQV